MIKQHYTFDKQKINFFSSGQNDQDDELLRWDPFDTDSYYKAVSEFTASNLKGCSCSSAARSMGCRCSSCKVVPHSAYKYRIRLKSGQSLRTACYDRTVTDLDENGDPVTVVFEVPVYKCRINEDPSTGRKAEKADRLYHIFASALVPRYGRHTYRFIFKVLAEYRKILSRLSDMTVRELCSRFMISVSTLYRWKESFIEQYHFIASKTDPSDRNRKISFTAEKIMAAGPQLAHDFFMTLRALTFMEYTAWKRPAGTQAPEMTQ